MSLGGSTGSNCIIRSPFETLVCNNLWRGFSFNRARTYKFTNHVHIKFISAAKLENLNCSKSNTFVFHHWFFFFFLTTTRAAGTQDEARKHMGRKPAVCGKKWRTQNSNYGQLGKNCHSLPLREGIVLSLPLNWTYKKKFGTSQTKIFTSENGQAIGSSEINTIHLDLSRMCCSPLEALDLL